MLKGMLLVRRKPGLSREDFIRHYEEVHVPLVLRHFPKVRGNVRNYVVPETASGELDFDCVTEFWWDSREEYDAAIAYLASGAGRPIHEDEERFIDRERLVIFLVEERASALGGPGGRR